MRCFRHSSGPHRTMDSRGRYCCRHKPASSGTNRPLGRNDSNRRFARHWPATGTRGTVGSVSRGRGRKRRSGTGSRSRAVARVQRTIRIRDTHPESGIMRPYSASKSGAAETEASKKRTVQKERVPEPVTSPTPAAPSQTAEKSSNIDSRAKPITESVADVQVIPRRIIATVGRWSPDVLRIVIRHVHLFGIGRLNINRRLIALHLRGDRLLRVGPQFAGRLSLGTACAARQSLRQPVERERRCRDRWSSECRRPAAKVHPGKPPWPECWDPNSVGARPLLVGDPAY